ncbi:MAG: cyclase family protein [Devosia sp.]
MCGHHVIESVRRRMIDRRSLFTGGVVLAGAAAAASLAAPPAAAATSGGTLIDLTHPLSENFPTYGGEPGFAKEKVFDFATDGLNLYNLTINEHTGTHMDAPIHFSADGQTVDEIPVANLMAPLVKIDIAARAADDPDTMLTPDDIRGWISANGDLPERCCVALFSGWGAHTTTDKFRNADADGVMHFPGFHKEATDMLLEESTAIGIAVDTLSLDPGPSTDFAVHYGWLPTNRWGLECVAGLADLPPSGATLIVGAPKNVGGTGGPTRVFALA